MLAQILWLAITTTNTHTPNDLAKYTHAYLKASCIARQRQIYTPVQSWPQTLTVKKATVISVIYIVITVHRLYSQFCKQTVSNMPYTYFIIPWFTLFIPPISTFTFPPHSCSFYLIFCHFSFLSLFIFRGVNGSTVCYISHIHWRGTP